MVHARACHAQVEELNGVPDCSVKMAAMFQPPSTLPRLLSAVGRELSSDQPALRGDGRTDRRLEGADGVGGVHAGDGHSEVSPRQSPAFDAFSGT